MAAWAQGLLGGGWIMSGGMAQVGGVMSGASAGAAAGARQLTRCAGAATAWTGEVSSGAARVAAAGASLCRAALEAAAASEP